MRYQSRVADLVDGPIREIHPRALAELGHEACIVALGVARDLRSGVIPGEEFDMGSFCGASCCIVGHIACRLGIRGNDSRGDFYSALIVSDALDALFEPARPSDPIRAADAIERYIYDGADRPWEMSSTTVG